MKCITVRDFRTNPGKIGMELPEEQEMVITHNGRPIAILTPVSDSELDESLKAVRAARAANAVRNMQMVSINRGNASLTDNEIENEIEAARSGKDA